MSQRILTVNVDLSHPLVVHPIPGIMGGGDRYADVIRVLVYQDGEPVTLSGTVTGYVMNRAGDTFAIDGVCSGNGAQVQLIEEVYELPGPITITVRLVNGDVKTTLAICSTAVKMTSTTTVYDPGDIVPNIDDVIAKLEEVDAATDAANAAAAAVPAMIATTFSTSTTYVAGQTVYYNGALYRFTANHAAGAWTGADAVQIVLGDEVGGVKSDVNDLKSASLIYKRALTKNEDLNALMEPGIYYYSSSIHPTNEPFNSGAVLMVYGFSDTTAKIQTAISYGGVDKGKFAYRELVTDEWSDWRYIRQSSNSWDGYTDERFDQYRQLADAAIESGYYPLYYTTEIGGFGGTAGSQYADTDSKTRTRWSDFVSTDFFSRIKFHLDDYSTYRYYVAGVDDNNTVVYTSGFKTTDLTLSASTLNGATKLRMLVTLLSNAEAGSRANADYWLHASVTYKPKVSANMTFLRQINTGEDLNNVVSDGIYYYYSDIHPTNEPFNSGAVLMVYGFSDTTAKIQTAISYGGVDKGKFAHRELVTGEWSDWHIVSHEDSEPLAGKTFSILGDSISTFRGMIPSGYTYHYPKNDVDEYTDTWWGQLITETGIELDVNNSYSGSPLCETGVYTERPRGASADRMGNLGTNPDYIVIFMGTNDFNQGAQVGTYKVGDSFPTDITTYRDAIAVALNGIQANYPSAKILMCTIPECYPSSSMSTATSNPFWTKTNGSISLFNTAIKEICPEYGAGVIDLCGIYTPITRSDFTDDGATSEDVNYSFGVHPNKAGMTKIMERVKEQMLRYM